MTAASSVAALAAFRASGEQGAARDYVRSVVRQWHTFHIRRLREAQGWSIENTDPFPTANEVAAVVHALTRWSRSTCRKRVNEVAERVGARPCAVTGRRVAMYRVRGVGA